MDCGPILYDPGLTWTWNAIRACSCFLVLGSRNLQILKKKLEFPRGITYYSITINSLSHIAVITFSRKPGPDGKTCTIFVLYFIYYYVTHSIFGA